MNEDAKRDLDLGADEAENVVGGTKKKAAAKHPAAAAHSSAPVYIHESFATTPVPDASTVDPSSEADDNSDC